MSTASAPARPGHWASRQPGRAQGLGNDRHEVRTRDAQQQEGPGSRQTRRQESVWNGRRAQTEQGADGQARGQLPEAGRKGGGVHPLVIGPWPLSGGPCWEVGVPHFVVLPNPKDASRASP